MSIDRNTLFSEAERIRDERQEGQNTAYRVGSALHDIVQYLEENDAAWRYNSGGGGDDSGDVPAGSGNSVTLYYSANETGPWHSGFYSDTDSYALVVRLDSNGNVIGSLEGRTGFRIVGEKGDGADYIDYRFGRSAQLTISGSSAPTIDTSWDSQHAGWGDYPPTPTDTYPYVWMKMTYMTWTATGYTAGTVKYTRITGEKGADGESTVVADFDDEMISIPVSSTGETTYFSGGVKWTTTASLYRGTRKLNIVSYTINADSGVTYTPSYVDDGNNHVGVKIEVTGFSANDIQNKKITVSLVASTGETGSCTAYINKIPSGSGSGTGDAALIYDLSLDSYSIKNNNNSYNPDSITVKVRKTEGTSTSFLNPTQWGDAGFAIKYKFGGKITSYDDSAASTLGNDGIITLNNSTVGSNTMLYISLWKISGSIMYDAETIHILKDGSVGNSYTLRYSSSSTVSMSTINTWHTDFQAGDIYAVEVTLNSNNQIIACGTPFRIVGEQGAGADYTDYRFMYSDSASTAPSANPKESWSDSPQYPAPANKYLWMRISKMIYQGNNSYTEDSNSVRVVRITGERGQDGTSVRVTGTEIKYVITTTATQPSATDFDNSTYTTFPSNVTPGNYVWSRTIVSYSAGDPSVIYSVARIAENGQPEQVESCVVEYAVSEAVVSNPSSLEWSSTMPSSVPQGYYLYTRTTITFENSDEVIVLYSYTRQGVDGKDAAAYEFIRFSNDAQFVNGKWVGTFTDADSSLITQRTTNEGDERNLIPYSGFNELYQNNAPVGWMKNGADSAINNLTKEEVNGVTFIHFDAPSGNNFGGIVTRMSDIDGTETNKYVAPILPNTDYTLSVMYKGTGVVALGLHFMLWKAATETTVAHWYKDNSNNYDIFQEWESGLTAGEGETALLTATKKLNLYYSTVDNTQDVTKWHAEYQAGDAYICAVRVNGSGTITEWGSVVPYAPEDIIYARVFLVHNYTSAAGSYSFAQPMLVKGTSAISYMPSPQEEMIGTVHGLWKGILRWDKPYASTRFADYEWSRVRDAEPRMTAWRDLGTPQKPDLDNGEPNTSEASEYNDAYHTTFYCGAYGEPCYDMVYDGTNYWICKETYVWNETVNDQGTDVYIFPVAGETQNQQWLAHWEKAKQYNFLVANTLFALRAFVEDLAVKKLNTVGSNSKIHVEGGIMEASSNLSDNNTKIKLGVDEDGNIVFQYWDGNKLLYDLGPKGIKYHQEVIGNKYTISDLYSGKLSDNFATTMQTWNPFTTGTSLLYLFTAGYTIESDGTITYAQGAQQYDGRVYNNAPSNPDTLPSSSNEIANGYYRIRRPSSGDVNSLERCTDNIIPEGVEIYIDYYVHYYNGLRTYSPFFITPSGNTYVPCTETGEQCSILESNNRAVQILG